MACFNRKQYATTDVYLPQWCGKQWFVVDCSSNSKKQNSRVQNHDEYATFKLDLSTTLHPLRLLLSNRRLGCPRSPSTPWSSRNPSSPRDNIGPQIAALEKFIQRHVKQPFHQLTIAPIMSRDADRVSCEIYEVRMRHYRVWTENMVAEHNLDGSLQHLLDWFFVDILQDPAFA